MKKWIPKKEEKKSDNKIIFRKTFHCYSIFSIQLISSSLWFSDGLLSLKWRDSLSRVSTVSFSRSQGSIVAFLPKLQRWMRLIITVLAWLLWDVLLNECVEIVLKLGMFICCQFLLWMINLTISSKRQLGDLAFLFTYKYATQQ